MPVHTSFCCKAECNPICCGLKKGLCFVLGEMEKYIEWKFYSYTLLPRLASCCQCDRLEGLWAPNVSVGAQMSAYICAYCTFVHMCAKAAHLCAYGTVCDAELVHFLGVAVIIYLCMCLFVYGWVYCIWHLQQNFKVAWVLWLWPRPKRTSSVQLFASGYGGDTLIMTWRQPRWKLQRAGRLERRECRV